MLRLTLLILVAMIMSVIGLFLIARAASTASHHQCRKCGYDLRGRPAALQCSECGAVLDESNTIVPGQVRMRRRVVIIGGILLVLGGLGVIFGSFAFLMLKMADAG